jgi:hypothetical protein
MAECMGRAAESHAIWPNRLVNLARRNGLARNLHYIWQAEIWFTDERNFGGVVMMAVRMRAKNASKPLRKTVCNGRVHGWGRRITRHFAQ